MLSNHVGPSASQLRGTVVKKAFPDRLKNQARNLSQLEAILRRLGGQIGAKLAQNQTNKQATNNQKNSWQRRI